MAKGFRSAQRDQVFLLPPDVREWLPPDHLVHLVIEVVEGLDLSAFRRRAKLGRQGREPFDPATLLALLIYAYAHGERSSRRIEALCRTDVAFRIISGNDAPDHTTIARFRAGDDEAFTELFEQVLAVCAMAGLGRFGTIAIDGTKIAANASRQATRSESTLRDELRAILDEAAAVDAAEDEQFGDARGDELPEELRDPSSRAARLKAAIEQITKEKAAEANQHKRSARVDYWDQRVAASQARYDRALAKATEIEQRRRAELDAGNPMRGRAPVPAGQHSDVIRAQQRLDGTKAKREAATTATPPRRLSSQHANTTDPDSRLMHTRHGAIQGYNTQIAVTDDQLVAAIDVVQDVNDIAQFTPMVDKVTQAVRRIRTATGRPIRIGTVLADVGYASEANLGADGPARLIAVRDRDQGPGHERMRKRLETPAGKRRYQRRAVTVEPVNGHLKDITGLRRFARRGLSAVNAEAHLAGLTLNLLKLHRAATAG